MAEREWGSGVCMSFTVLYVRQHINVSSHNNYYIWILWVPVSTAKLENKLHNTYVSYAIRCLSLYDNSLVFALTFWSTIHLVHIWFTPVAHDEQLHLHFIPQSEPTQVTCTAHTSCIHCVYWEHWQWLTQYLTQYLICTAMTIPPSRDCHFQLSFYIVWRKTYRLQLYNESAWYSTSHLFLPTGNMRSHAHFLEIRTCSRPLAVYIAD